MIYAIIKSALIIRLNNKNMRVKIVLSVLGLFLFLGAAGAAFAQEDLPEAGLSAEGAREACASEGGTPVSADVRRRGWRGADPVVKKLR